MMEEMYVGKVWGSWGCPPMLMIVLGIHRTSVYDEGSAVIDIIQINVIDGVKICQAGSCDRKHPQGIRHVTSCRCRYCGSK
jgi:hypothetical protein